MYCVRNRIRDNRQSKASKRVLNASALAPGLIIGLLVSHQAGAKALDGPAINELALQGIWAAAQGSGYGYWSWNEDRSVCLRLHDRDGDCADTGTWAIEGDAICYELQWWGESYGQRSLCLSVNSLGDDQYEASYEGDKVTSTLFRFEVLNP